MKNNVIELREISQYENFLGSKTLNLKKCADWGFDVPKFIALPSNISNDLLADEIFRKKIAQEVKAILPSDRYAVRSSALIEDGKSQSYAGQFLTKINLSGDGLERGIFEVLKQAEAFLHGDLARFSLIIQEYILADISGVTFTRNPNGGREMMIEHGFCEGEKIVSGEIKPEKVAFYWNEQFPSILPASFFIDQVVEKFKELEIKNDFPQDIEWCKKDNQFYLLQTRPITTISQAQYAQIVFLDQILPQNEKYFFEKTEISEIAPRPATATYDLLQLIYTKNGPVDKVYEKYGVSYENTQFLKIIGNELFVDKEKELQGLLPAYTYLRSKEFIPKFHNLSKLWPTLRNLFFLNTIKTKDCEKIFAELKTKIEEDVSGGVGTGTALEKFLDDYALIFETNLLSGLSIKKAKLLLKNEPITFTEILAGYSHFIDLTKYQIEPPWGAVGNSLEFLDEADFIANNITGSSASEKMITWWKKIPEYRKKMMQSMLAEAIIYNRLRELGRWLTIKNINALRSSLLDFAKKNEFEEVKDVFFANFDAVLNGGLDESNCVKNKRVYAKYAHFCLPNSITSSVITKESKTSGVSSGLANGILQSQEFIEAKNNKDGKIILYTEILSPDLTKYFNRISGIVSNNGGLLSHLAIMAREKNIPVVVGYSITNGKFKLGDFVQIDGSSGEILKIDI
jgi:phosphohistidine swiveling domain-containing protein